MTQVMDKRLTLNTEEKQLFRHEWNLWVLNNYKCISFKAKS